MIGKFICDFAPNKENNRNSEGDFLRLRDGNIIFIYSRYGSAGFWDGDSADLYATVSKDNGESFCKPYLLISCEQFSAENIMSTSLLRMQNGDIGLFLLVKNDTDQCIPHIIRSSDEGKSWNKPVRCCDREGYFVVNNDRVIRLKSGRIIIPAAYHKTECAIDANGKKKFKTLHPGTLSIFASDDDGFSWKTISEGTSIPYSRGCKTGVQEPGVLELSDGRLWCYIRNDSGKQYEAFSSDDGVSWTNPLPSIFSSPVSPLSTKRLSDGRIVAVWNPIPLHNGRSRFYNGFWTDGRNPLVIAISSDDGETFSEYKAIETDESRGYAYTAIFETNDNSILLAYCAGGPEDNQSMLNRLRIKKINLSEI